MAIFFKIVLMLSFLLLTACAEQPTVKKPAQPKAAVTTKPAASTQSVAPVESAKKPTSNVHISENEGPSNSVDGAYYVQNRILSSGGAVSGAMMGS